MQQSTPDKDLVSQVLEVHTAVTHDDIFHADEVTAIATLKIINKYFNVVRTRDPAAVDSADMRIDIGKRYNILTLDFDHHQNGGAGERANGIPYASAGLIWKHFGHILAPEHESFTYIDHKIFQPIDAEDNYVSIYEIKKKKPYTLYDYVNSFNALWQDTNDEAYRPQHECFNNAVSGVKQILSNEIAISKRMPEYNAIVRAAIDWYKEAPYVVIEKNVPWSPIVVRETEKKYVIYPIDNRTWRSDTVPTKINGFIPRLPFPEEWRGLYGKALADVSGVDDAQFCHRTGFMAVASSKNGAIALAEKSIFYNC